MDGEIRGNLVHDFCHDLFHHRPETPGADLAVDGLLGNGRQSALFQLQLHMIQLQQLLILPGEGVFRLGQNANQVLFGQILQRGYHR